MADVISTIHNMRLMDELASKDTFIHRLHPLIKLVTTLVYLTSLISMGRYEVMGLIPFALYPVLVFSLADLPMAPILRRILLVEPLIIGIGILNPIFDNYTVMLGGITISRGWITFVSIFIKCGLTVTASILLVATTGMDKLAAAMRMLRIPKIFVLQLLLTYRYISVLMEEVSRMLRAYFLRAPRQKGIEMKAWGAFAGQLLLRTLDRAQRVYEAMSLRGFNGDINLGRIEKTAVKDYIYLTLWCIFFIIARLYNIPIIIGSLFTGVI
ncbi:cobalt ECF transporter T component CbiQ [Clostridium thermarum]|uniref:cobalt ECF transporter T component CbiQ n=1 Tax=Clostridium thermarum TaxID=1716543 RepID=UPI00111FCB15|nr:cobalt ECF transporter T component CbiQ [Clostridium thermarum]